MPEKQPQDQNIMLSPGTLQQQLSALPESQLQQIVLQANQWAAYVRHMQLMGGIAKEMKEIPELASEIITPRTTNPLTRVEFPEEGGVLTFMEKYDQPFKGYPYHEFVDKIDFVKKTSRSLMSGLYHQLKRRNRIWFLTVLPGIWIAKDAIRAGVYVIFRVIERFRIKKERYCTFVREIHRAFSIERSGETPEETEFRQYLRDAVCMLLEFDNAYRFRAQDILAEMDQEMIRKDTAGEVLRLLKLMSEREFHQEVKDTWKLFKYGVRFYLRFDRRMKRLIADVLSRLDLDKVKLSKEDKAFCAPRKDYTFGFVTYPGPEDDRIIKIARFVERCDDDKGKIMDGSTKAHNDLSERHKKEQEEMALDIKPKTEEEQKEINAGIEKVSLEFNEEMRKLQERYEPRHRVLTDHLMSKEQSELYARQLKERQDLDAKYNDLLKEADEVYAAERKKLDEQTKP